MGYRQKFPRMSYLYPAEAPDYNKYFLHPSSEAPELPTPLQESGHPEALPPAQLSEPQLRASYNNHHIWPIFFHEFHCSIFIYYSDCSYTFQLNQALPQK